MMIYAPIQELVENPEQIEPSDSYNDSTIS